MASFLSPLAVVSDPQTGRPIQNADLYFGVVNSDPQQEENQIMVNAVNSSGIRYEIEQPVTTNKHGLITAHDAELVSLQLDLSNYSYSIVVGGELILHSPNVAIVPPVPDTRQALEDFRRFGAPRHQTGRAYDIGARVRFGDRTYESLVPANTSLPSSSLWFPVDIRAMRPLFQGSFHVIGRLAWFAETFPAGWLPVSDSRYQVANYPELAALRYDENNEFIIPDLLDGERFFINNKNGYLRGIGSDTERGLGSVDEGQEGDHTHTLEYEARPPGSQTETKFGDADPTFPGAMEAAFDTRLTEGITTQPTTAPFRPAIPEPRHVTMILCIYAGQIQL